MSLIRNPIPNMSIKDLKKVYQNRKANNLEKNKWINFIKKYNTNV